MNLSKYDQCFKEVFGVKEEMLNEEFRFGEGKWNSFAHMELIIKLEDTFDIFLYTEDITHFGNYENGKKILAKHGINI